jgi:hypothetical protein
MKKVFALLFCIGTVTAVFAQKGRGRDASRDVILGQRNETVYNGNNGRYDGYMTPRERDAQIAQINREYNWKIQSVKRDRYLRNAERKRQIRFLENERDARIRAVWQRYNHRSSRVYGRRY